MAIKWLENNSYYKIIYEESYIKNNEVLIAISQYLNEEERIKEKNRLSEQESFISKLHALAIQNPNEISENQYIKFLSVESLFKRFTNEESISNYSNKEYELLINLGFKMEWINDPILFIGNMLVNCGTFDNCEITHKYLYEKLKSRMNNIVDC